MPPFGTISGGVNRDGKPTKDLRVLGTGTRAFRALPCSAAGDRRLAESRHRVYLHAAGPRRSLAAEAGRLGPAALHAAAAAAHERAAAAQRSDRTCLAGRAYRRKRLRSQRSTTRCRLRLPRGWALSAPPAIC